MIDHNPDHLEFNQSWEEQYLDLLRRILRDGEDRMDRTGTGTRALFAEQIKIDLAKGFPMVTTKKMAWKALVSELLWFIEGSGDERRLAEILHGTADPAKKTIWTDNATASYWIDKAKFDGDLGRVYGVQWREWLRYKPFYTLSDDNEVLESALYTADKPVDQLADLMTKLKSNPTDRRLIISSWNVGEIGQMALPPCHMMAQFYLSNDKKLSCQMYQRSVDSFLGLPFNIASYALFTHMIAHSLGEEYGVGTLTMVLGDTHIYSNHVEQVTEQVSRAVLKPPTLNLTPERKLIDCYRMEDFSLQNYQSHGPIKAEMAV